MNPKTPQDLDPKLKEAYDRVMGGNFSPSTPTTPNAIPKIESVPTIPVPNPTPQTAPSSIPLTIPVQTPQPSLNVMSPSSAPISPMQQTTPTKKKLKFPPIIFLVVGLVFFVIYAVVWAKVFKLF